MCIRCTFGYELFGTVVLRFGIIVDWFGMVLDGMYV